MVLALARFHPYVWGRPVILRTDNTVQVQYGIELQRQPHKQRPKRQPLALQPVEEQEIRTMLEQDIIEPSQSPIASPVVLLKKSTGSYRFCIEYRDLNSHIWKMPIPFPGLRTAWTVWSVLSGSALLISVPVTGRPSWRRRSGTRQSSAPTVGCISSML